MQSCDTSRMTYRKKADRLYCADGYRMKVIIAWLMAFLCAMAIDLITSAMFVLAFPDVLDTDEGIKLVNTIIVAAIAVLVLPMALGVNKLAFGRLCGEEMYVTSIFSAYKNLPRTWFVMLVELFPACIAAAVVLGIIPLWRLVSGFALIQKRLWASIPVYAAIIIMALALLALTALLWARMFLLPAYAFRGDMSAWRAFECSFSASRGRTWQILGLLARYTGWLVLDVLTLGVLFIIHTAPRFAADYTVLADEALRNTLK